MSKNSNKPFDQAVRNLSTAVFKRGMIIAWITLIVSLSITSYAWYYTKSSIDANAKERFNLQTDEISNAIIDRMYDCEQLLRGGAGLFYASDEVTREDWKNYVRNLKIDENLPGILGIGFLKVIGEKDKEKTVRQIRREGFSNFRIWPDGEREFYTPIIYIEPFNEVNKRAFGYDMFSEPIRKKTMETARDIGEAVVSGKVTLVQEVDDNIHPGFLMYFPLYDKKMDEATTEGRRKTLIGYIYAPFRMNDLMDGIFVNRLNNVRLEIYDDHKISSEGLLYANGRKENYNERNFYEKFKTVAINGRNWALHFTALSGFEATIDRQKPLIVLILGIVVSSLLFIVSRNLGNIFIINKKLEQLLESTIEGVYGIDRKGNCTFINNSASNMLGYQPEECLKKNMHNLIHHHKENGDIYPFYESPIMKSMEMQVGCLIDTDVFWKNDGTFFPVEYSSYPLIDDSETTGAVIAFNDITERKKTLFQIESSLKEKEVLLREIHHRVKNNLQIISSILNLQTNYITDKKSLGIFEESRNRVRSMALIHEKLYQNDSLSRLNIKDYVIELVDNLMSSYRTDNRIQSEIKISDILLNADTAIPLGLIINELVSNSLKYAFPNNEMGKIEVSIIQINRVNFKMIISDNGIGIPEDFDIKKNDTLGLQLVNSLVIQLDGELALSNLIGTKFEINFKGLNLDSKK